MSKQGHKRRKRDPVAYRLILALCNGRFERYRGLISRWPVRSKTVRKWFQRPLFLVTGSGRSGTKWLSTTLALVEDCIVVHEPVPGESRAHIEVVHSEKSAVNYIREFRKKEMVIRNGTNIAKSTAYGEVNGYLRRHTLYLKNEIPSMHLVQLVKNPCDVIRSHMNRGAFSSTHPDYHSFRPPAVDEVSRNWQDLNEFQKSCWLWQWDNKFLRETCDSYARFEDIVTSYEQFEAQILAPLGLQLSKQIWSKAIQKRVNPSRRETFGRWETWSIAQKDWFAQQCGYEMRKYGYAVPE